MKHQLAYLGVAYTAIWAGIAGYLLYLGRRQRAVERPAGRAAGTGSGHARVGLAVVGRAEYDAAPGRGRLHRRDRRGNGAYPGGWMQASGEKLRIARYYDAVEATRRVVQTRTPKPAKQSAAITRLVRLRGRAVPRRGALLWLPRIRSVE